MLLKLKLEWLNRIELLVDESVLKPLEFVGESTTDEQEDVELLLGLNVEVELDMDAEELIEFSGVILTDEFTNVFEGGFRPVR